MAEELVESGHQDARGRYDEGKSARPGLLCDGLRHRVLVIRDGDSIAGPVESPPANAGGVCNRSNDAVGPPRRVCKTFDYFKSAVCRQGISNVNMATLQVLYNIDTVICDAAAFIPCGALCPPCYCGTCLPGAQQCNLRRH
jgi:hypothetical protein